MKNLYILLFTILIAGTVDAQQVPIYNQYVVNNFAISPAYAGYNSNYEAFMTYRKSWLDFPGAPVNKVVNINGPITGNSGFGVNIISDNIGVFTNFSGVVNYAYHVNITQNQTLSFALGGEVYESSIDLTESAVQNATDPVMLGNQTFDNTLLNVTAGMLYTFENLHLGFVASRLLDNEITGNAETGSTIYTSIKHYKGHLSYQYQINDNFSIKPIAMVHYVENNPLFYEGTLMFNYKNRLWFSGTYRKDQSIAASVGGAVFSRLILFYSYELAPDGVLQNSSGTHEITLGFMIGKNKKHKYPNRPTIFGASSMPVYYNWLDE